MFHMNTGLNRSLADTVVAGLENNIRAGQYQPGSRLPPESALCEDFQVSRATVRAAIKELNVVGLIRTQRGVGSFVRSSPSVLDGLERMGSITDSIRASGKSPDHDYARRSIRQVLPEEAERMEVAADTEVLELRRRILADGDVVAYSYDLIPTSLLKGEFSPRDVSGSMFAYLRDALGIYPTLGIAEVHAVSSEYISWGENSREHRLFILLDQLHFTDDRILAAYSRTYFVEGAYAFTLIRR